MGNKSLDRRRFMAAFLGSTAGALGIANTISKDLWAQPAQAIWNQNADEVNSHMHPDAKNADIWVFSGQSNSQGWGMLKAPVEPDPRILFFNAANSWVIAKEPLNPRFTNWDPDPVRQNIQLQRNGVEFPAGLDTEQFIAQMMQNNIVMGGVGPGLAFAKHVVKFVDRPLGLVYCGVGGSPIKSWDPSLKGSNYEAMIRRIAMVGGNIKGLIWYQGESDAMTPGAEDLYEAAILKLIDNIRRDTQLPSLPVLCVQIARFVWNYDSHAHSFEKIRDIQRRLGSLRPNVYTVSALDLPLEDAAHISFEGQLRLGRRLAELALSQVYKLKGHGCGINLKEVELLQPENRRPMVRVRFSGVTGKLTSPGLPTGFELRSQLPAQEPHAPAAETAMPIIYRMDFDPGDPACVILGVFDNALINSGGAKFHPLKAPFRLIYGAGSSPYVNIVDQKDIPVPAFGPVDVTDIRTSF
jgi:sialate O-acetylesterase